MYKDTEFSGSGPNAEVKERSRTTEEELALHIASHLRYKTPEEIAELYDGVDGRVRRNILRVAKNAMQAEVQRLDAGRSGDVTREDILTRNKKLTRLHSAIDYADMLLRSKDPTLEEVVAGAEKPVLALFKKSNALVPLNERFANNKQAVAQEERSAAQDVSEANPQVLPNHPPVPMEAPVNSVLSRARKAATLLKQSSALATSEEASDETQRENTTISDGLTRRTTIYRAAELARGGIALEEYDNLLPFDDTASNDNAEYASEVIGDSASTAETFQENFNFTDADLSTYRAQSQEQEWQAQFARDRGTTNSASGETERNLPLARIHELEDRRDDVMSRLTGLHGTDAADLHTARFVSNFLEEHALRRYETGQLDEDSVKDLFERFSEDFIVRLIDGLQRNLKPFSSAKNRTYHFGDSLRRYAYEIHGQLIERMQQQFTEVNSNTPETAMESIFAFIARNFAPIVKEIGAPKLDGTWLQQPYNIAIATKFHHDLRVITAALSRGYTQVEPSIQSSASVPEDAPATSLAPEEGTTEVLSTKDTLSSLFKSSKPLFFVRKEKKETHDALSAWASEYLEMPVPKQRMYRLLTAAVDTMSIADQQAFFDMQNADELIEKMLGITEFAESTADACTKLSKFFHRLEQQTRSNDINDPMYSQFTARAKVYHLLRVCFLNLRSHL